jgi:predicted transcriptional regulator
MARIGRPPKSATKRKSFQTAVRIDIELRRQLEQLAERDGRDLSDHMRDALKEYVQRKVA